MKKNIYNGKTNKNILIKIKTFENEITKNDMLKRGNTIALILQSNGKSHNNLND